MRKEIITKRQKELLSIIYDYIKNSGYPPSFEEMKNELDVASNPSIIDLLTKLVKQRFIERTESSARSMKILPLGYEILNKPPLAPFLGTTSAGPMTEAIEIPGEWQTISKDVSKLKGDIFILKISGDSMKNADINDGDVVLVRAQKEFYSGDIVLAELENGSTIKRFISDDKPPFVYLKPENPKYDVILFEDGMRLVGKVISVFKNGQWKSVK
mgnify:CR=1 FL=1